ncbi:actin-like protein [Phytophthora infestans T30-4]|uniref:Actin-like protein n=2 Tax=Phytophthora infestans TaxID=4787 RepID=D0MYR6_PHYIT|nr:actin-like protein [Phytophthora infestans T30-4]EEY66314.1 actin-like protein [Phytophthora infestans T30-4]KAF4029465.1 actin [Phytophthora infestans]|eukprot:XP_002906913.1 actin-like protein [Phytophthora infestans T30-4]
MYCGDDVEAVVGDVGTGLSKFGLAGEDTPQLVLPSIVGRRPPPPKDAKDAPATSAVLGDMWHRHDLEVVRPIEACAVANWDALEKVWSHAFDRLHVDAKIHPVITSAASCFANDALHNAASRDGEKYLEMMFETFQVPAFYMAKDAVLDAFAFGRSLALVAEIGAGASRVVPVYDGYALERPAQYSPVGCNQLSEYLEHLMSTQKPKSVTVRPRGTFTRKLNPQTGALETIPLSEELTTPPAMPSSYLKFARADLFRDMRETTCITSETALEGQLRDSPGQASSPEPEPLEITEQQYELPDGQTIVLGKERYEVPEFLLHPKNFGGAVVKNEQHAAAAAKVVAKGLHTMLYDAVQLCDADLRRDLLTNIILCGGGSLTPGITERLHAELTRMVPSTFKVRFTTVTKIERQFSVFIGGSILASLGSFQQLWVSKREYDEVGAHALCADRFC